MKLVVGPGLCIFYMKYFEAWDHMYSNILYASQDLEKQKAPAAISITPPTTLEASLSSELITSMARKMFTYQHRCEPHDQG